ncbi:unnamed protein product [Auanema sp. JU1783]|nr:unnamed protein product [Auanema sp. JU1783]
MLPISLESESSCLSSLSITLRLTNQDRLSTDYDPTHQKKDLPMILVMLTYFHCFACLMQHFPRTTGSQPGTSGIQSPHLQKQFRFGSTRSGVNTPGGYSTYSSSTTTDRVGCLTAVRMSAWAKLTRFSRRFLYVRQMDFEFAAWQMVHLLAKPKQVYRNFLYRKRTKDQFARDDPAFLVLLSLALLFSSIFYAVALSLSLWGFTKFFLWVVFIDCIGVGIVIATALWWVSNTFLRKVKDQDVEWGYCFDIHLNAFFPFLILLHVLLPILYPTFVDSSGFFAVLLGNTIWFIGAIYYVYITFLGYTALPILHQTQVFLYPITFLFIAWIASVTAGWNISKLTMGFYRYRAENHQMEHHMGL